MVANLFNEQIQIADTFSEDERLVTICDDALECAKALPTNFFSLIVTSPPYNLGKEYEQRSSLHSYLAQQKPLIHELKRVLKHNGSLCWQVSKYFVDGGTLFFVFFFLFVFSSL